MYMRVPPPVVMVNLENGSALTDEVVTAKGADGVERTLKQLGVVYKNEPVSMRAWFLRDVVNFYKGYLETKAARRTEKAFAKAEKLRAEGADPVVEISKDDADLLRKKTGVEKANAGDKDVMNANAAYLMQFETYLDAIKEMSDERPAAPPAPLQAV